MSKIYVNTDGGARGNPGPAAIGVVFYDQSENLLHTFGKCIGSTTNNVAEYQAVIEALKIIQKSRWFKDCKQPEIYCRLDSQLVVEQICGRYKVKNDVLRGLYQEILSLIGSLSATVHFCHIPREENKIADKLVNEALDKENAR